MPSVYRLAASAGIPAGLILTLMSAGLLLSVRMPASWLVVAGAVLMPLYLLRRMRAVGAAWPAYSRFMPLWLFGMYTVIFGALICTLLSSLYVTMVEPDFINVWLDGLMASVPDSADAGLRDMYQRQFDLLDGARERHLLPSPLEFISSMGWSTAFFGSLLCMPLAALTARRRRFSPRGL